MKLFLSRARRRDESGAVAVMFALLSLILLSVSAMAVDLGNAWQEKRQVQAGSDLAAEAGVGIAAANLPKTGSVNNCSYGAAGALSTDQGVLDVAEYLASQKYPLPRSAADTTAYNTMKAALPAALTDCSMDNGEVVYGLPTYNSTSKTWSVTFNKNQLSLVAPPHQVNFGLAGIMGFQSTKVNGVSTMEIRSPKMATLPFYAFSGCDYGPQTLQQPNNGQAAGTVNLANATDDNGAVVASITPTTYPVDPTNQFVEPLTISVTGASGAIQQVGFFESGNVGSGPAPVTTTSFTTTSSGPGSTTVTIADLPNQARGVSGVQEYWYIRVMIGGVWSPVYSGKKSDVLTPMLTIGNPPLVCAQGSSSGNFGTLLLTHNGYTGWDAVGSANVALGLDSTLAIYPAAARLADGTCSTAQPQTVLWAGSGTNCVDTDTGMSAKVATGGFLGLGSSAVGGNQYLLKPNGKTKCANGGTTEATTVLKGQTINNDTLSCFFTSPTTHVADVDSSTYTLTGPAISNAIYDSPRFGYVPVLPVQPANGGSKKYQIIDFRACFITDQPASAIKGDGSNPGNGIVTDNNGVNSIEVIFLNPNALPTPPVKNGTINYTGSGVKLPVLVN
jgi:hypothetical protein